jgi:hypothetical protein
MARMIFFLISLSRNSPKEPLCIWCDVYWCDVTVNFPRNNRGDGVWWSPEQYFNALLHLQKSKAHVSWARRFNLIRHTAECWESKRSRDLPSDLVARLINSTARTNSSSRPDPILAIMDGNDFQKAERARGKDFLEPQIPETMIQQRYFDCV